MCAKGSPFFVHVTLVIYKSLSTIHVEVHDRENGSCLLTRMICAPGVFAMPGKDRRGRNTVFNSADDAMLEFGHFTVQKYLSRTAVVTGNILRSVSICILSSPTFSVRKEV